MIAGSTRFKQLKLESLCTLITDGTHSSPKASSSGDFLYLTSKNVRPGSLDLNNVSYVSESDHNTIFRACPVQFRDVLLVKDGANSGSAAVNTLHDQFSLLSSVAVLRPNPEILDAGYLMHWLNTDLAYELMTQRMSGSAIRRLILREISGLSVPVFPLEEQKRIAAILDKADAIRRKREQAIKLADEFLRSFFLDMFGHGSSRKGWSFAKISDLATSIRTGPFGSQLLHSEFVDSGIAVLGIDNAVQNTFLWAKPRFISEAKYKALERYTVRPADVLITIMGTCGRVAVVPDDIGRAINTKHLCCLTLDAKQVLPTYLHAALLYDPEIRRQLGASQRGAIMDGLNMQTVRDVALALPPLSVQERFERCRSRFQSVKTLSAQLARKCYELVASLTRQAFNGEL